jgi:serine protease Do
LQAQAQGRESAQIIYNCIRPAVVVVVKVQSQINQGVSSVASCFVTARPDWVVTNYHAVSEALLEPDDHLLVIQTLDGRDYEVRVLAVDVLNDLAILQLDKAIKTPLLELRETLPSSLMGQRL